MGRGRYRHETVKSNFSEILGAWVRQHPVGRVFTETMFRLDEHSSPIPDVSLVGNARLSPGLEGYIEGAPDLAVEVVSSETAAALETKVNLYLAHGAMVVWVAFPEQRIVRAYDASGASRKLEPHHRLEASDLLPGFSCPVAEFFAGI